MRSTRARRIKDEMSPERLNDLADLFRLLWQATEPELQTLKIDVAGARSRLAEILLELAHEFPDDDVELSQSATTVLLGELIGGESRPSRYH